MHTNTAQWKQNLTKKSWALWQKSQNKLTIESWNVGKRQKVKQTKKNVIYFFNLLLFDVFVKRNKDFKSFESLIQ